MKNKIKITIGGVVFALALALNIQFAMDGYGIDHNNIIAQVMANTGGTGGSYNGLCCQELYKSCHHPNNMTFADAQWKSGLSYCP